MQAWNFSTARLKTVVCSEIFVTKIAKVTVHYFFKKTNKKMATLLEFIVSQRWLFAIFLLPISFFYDIFWYLRSKWVLYQGSAPRKHQERVDFVQKQVLDWQKFGDGRKMCTARPTWMSISQQKITYKVFKGVLKFSEFMIWSSLNCKVWILIFFPLKNRILSNQCSLLISPN